MVTGWAPVSRFNETMANAGYDMPDGDEPAAVESRHGDSRRRDDMGDDIPF